MCKFIATFVFGLFFAFLPNFANASCIQFNGRYILDSQGCYTIHHGTKYSDFTYTGMRIDADSSDKLSMFYEEGAANHGFTTNYIADSKVHDGDTYNTGKTYIASCDNSRIHSVRYGLLIAPIDMTFIQNSDGTFTLTETVTSSDPFIRSCSFSATH